MKTTWFRVTSAKERDDAIGKLGPILQARGGQTAPPPEDGDAPPFILVIEHREEDDSMAASSPTSPDSPLTSRIGVDLKCTSGSRVEGIRLDDEGWWVVRAAVVTRFGGPEVFQLIEQPDPVAGAGHVVIAVEVADTLWLETVVRAGAGQDYWPMRPPYVPGNGVAGRVLHLGTGVDRGLADRRVVAHTGNEGGYADRAVGAAEALSIVPDDVSPTVREAAGERRRIAREERATGSPTSAIGGLRRALRGVRAESSGPGCRWGRPRKEGRS